MKKGLIVGKFYPPHAGHHYLIDTALKNCDKLTILICDKPEYLIAGKLRLKWLKNTYPYVDIRVVEDKLDDNDSRAWAKYSLAQMNNHIDIVFTSESYGKRWAKEIGCEHYLVDIDRTKFPCSGTLVRQNPYKMWQYLADPVKAYFTYRVCVVGAESTGKTTLAQQLAKYYKTVWVPEYGRAYTELNVKNIWSYKWQESDFIKIAKKQANNEDQLALKSNKVLICDTDVFATTIWHKRYMGYRSPIIEKLATKRPPISLYIIPDIKTPFVQDGLRDGIEIRDWMHQTFVNTLKMWGKNYITVEGNQEQRLEKAVKCIDQLMQVNAGISGKELFYEQV